MSCITTYVHMITKKVLFIDGKKVREYEGLKGRLYAGSDYNDGIKDISNKPKE